MFLCVADIHLVGIAACLLIPNPDLGDVAVLSIAVKVALDVPFGVPALGACGNGVVPAVGGSAVQRQPHAFGIALGKVDPVADVKGRLGGRLRGWLCRLGRF